MRCGPGIRRAHPVRRFKQPDSFNGTEDLGVWEQGIQHNLSYFLGLLWKVSRYEIACAFTSVLNRHNSASVDRALNAKSTEAIHYSGESPQLG